MTATLSITFPIFALILAGYLSARRRILDIGATDALNRFVVYLALPALLFQATTRISLAEINQPGFIFALASAMLIAFLAAALVLRRSVRLADATIHGLNASYSNTGFMGIPLCIAAFGEASLPVLVVATIMTACLLFAISIVLIEVDLNASGGIGATAKKVSLVLVRNPLLVAPLVGLALVVMGIPLPEPIDRFAKLLGGAASPCALVTIGLFIGQQQVPFDRPLVARLVALKLLFQPAIGYLLAFHVFSMPPLWATILVLLCALPTGTGPFMLAKLYDRQSAPTSGVILVSTVISVLTITVVLTLFGIK